MISYIDKDILYNHPDLYEKVYQTDIQQAYFCLDVIKKHFNSDTNISVLDLCCGTGNVLDIISKTYANTYGVDYAEKMIAYGQKKYSNLSLSRADIRKLDLGKKFDVVLCLGCALTHAVKKRDLKQFFKCFKRHIKPNGILIIITGEFEVFKSMPTECKIDIPGFLLEAKFIIKRGCRIKRYTKAKLESGKTLYDCVESKIQTDKQVSSLLQKNTFILKEKITEAKYLPAGKKAYIAQKL